MFNSLNSDSCGFKCEIGPLLTYTTLAANTTTVLPAGAHHVLSKPKDDEVNIKLALYFQHDRGTGPYRGVLQRGSACTDYERR
jgi:hypothetical protein